MIRAIVVFFFLLFSATSFCQPNIPDNQDSIKEYTIVEEMPVFPGGEQALLQWIIKEISDIKTDSSCIPFKIFISFTIDTTGVVINPDVKTTSTFPVDCTIPADYEKAIAEEIIKMPLWIPGKQSGKAVRVRYRVPIGFDWQ